ncbi:glycosyl hydrolase family 31 [Anopheles sinensis]|uniref:Glycosyl hydrolase family 31 n=1 Tax=Anopheles sinensis TaxID=74873 RepID=A0A084WBN8_ANOSI|nr:glycosyl hydrolase family 31 [Anopheles sinensis]
MQQPILLTPWIPFCVRGGEIIPMSDVSSHLGECKGNAANLSPVKRCSINPLHPLALPLLDGRGCSVGDSRCRGKPRMKGIASCGIICHGVRNRRMDENLRCISLLHFKWLKGNRSIVGGWSEAKSRVELNR